MLPWRLRIEHVQDSRLHHGPSCLYISLLLHDSNGVACPGLGLGYRRLLAVPYALIRLIYQARHWTTIDPQLLDLQGIGETCPSICASQRSPAVMLHVTQVPRRA